MIEIRLLLLFVLVWPFLGIFVGGAVGRPRGPLGVAGGAALGLILGIAVSAICAFTMLVLADSGMT
jgi:hypothetical protein